MKSVQITKTVVNLLRLSRELSQDGILGPHFDYFDYNKGVFLFHFFDTFESDDETYLRFTFLPNFVDVDDNADWEPRIYDYAIVDSKKRYFQNINYLNEVSIYWHRRETWGSGNEKGLLLKVEYFADEEMTELVLEVEVSYQQDPFGNLVSKNTVRTWYLRNGTPHPDKKQKPSPKLYTPTESRKATMRRRENVVAQLEGQLIDMLKDPEATLEEQAASLTLGVQFLTAISSELNQFLNSGNIAGISTFVQEPSNQANFPFLLLELAPGYPVWQFIIDGVTY